MSTNSFNLVLYNTEPLSYCHESLPFSMNYYFLLLIQDVNLFKTHPAVAVEVAYIEINEMT